MSGKITVAARRKQRIRNELKARNNGRPRLSVSRSHKNISVQVIDDDAGRTLAAASTNEPDLRVNSGGTVAAAARVGELVAERANAAGITTVVFDRGGFAYHGRVAAIAEAARKSGLEF